MFNIKSFVVLDNGSACLMGEWNTENESTIGILVRREERKGRITVVTRMPE